MQTPRLQLRNVGQGSSWAPGGMIGNVMEGAGRCLEPKACQLRKDSVSLYTLPALLIVSFAARL